MKSKACQGLPKNPFESSGEPVFDETNIFEASDKEWKQRNCPDADRTRCVVTYFFQGLAKVSLVWQRQIG